MPSPFPGMNPYLEHSEVWLDFHESLMPRIRDAINAHVGPNYLVKIEEHVYVHELGLEEARLLLGRSDVSVSERCPAAVSTDESIAVLDPPLRVTPLLVDELRESYIEIRDKHRRTLVTVVELLSPSNKSGDDRRQYLAKRDQLLRSPAHLVEIDLLRGGVRMPFDRLPQCDYYVMVSRAQERPGAGVWPIGLRDPLPEIPIPLKLGDPDVKLNLQPLLHDVHDKSGYAKYIYDNEPDPPLAAEDAAWAAERLRGIAGLEGALAKPS